MYVLQWLVLWDLDNCNSKLGVYLLDSHLDQWKLESKQHSVPTGAESDWGPLVECAPQGIPALEMPHYPWHTNVNIHRYTAHTRPCTRWLRLCKLQIKCINTSSPQFIILLYKKMYHACLQLRFPCRFISHGKQQRLQTRLTFGYVLDVIITYSRLLCGTPFCNYCQYSHSRHISHTQPATHDLSHILGYLHIRGK